MKRLFYLLLASVLIFSACSSSRKMLQKGQYDAAIAKSVKKLRKNPSKTKEISVLKDAFLIANQKNKERIEFLKLSGEPDIWDEVFSLYSGMKNRQDLVKTLPSGVLQEIGFLPVNYDMEIIAAKKKPAEFFYARAMQYLSQNDKYSARKAYDDLQKVKYYYENYKDADAKIIEAYNRGVTHVLYKVEGKNNYPLPPDLYSKLIKISTAELGNLWVLYDNAENKATKYEYQVIINISDIEVTPEWFRENKYTESKDIEDGWQYVLDGRGNVMKDSLGNDMKVPKYKNISCQLIEVDQKKNAFIRGTIDLIDLRTRQMMLTEPVAAHMVFEHYSTVAIGDQRALKEETKKKLGKEPLPFPTNQQMILDAGDILNNMARSFMQRATKSID